MSKSSDISKEMMMRYLSGEASAEEQQALREAAKDDPFLAEALEGLDENPAAAMSSVPRLDEQVDKRLGTTSKPIIPMSIVWKVSAAAAAIVILLGSVFIFNNIKQQETVAENESQVTEEEAPTKSTERAPMEESEGSGYSDVVTDSILFAKDLESESVSGGLQAGYQIAYGNAQQPVNAYWYTSGLDRNGQQTNSSDKSYLWDWRDREDALNNEEYLALNFEEDPPTPAPEIEYLADEMEADEEEVIVSEEVIAGTLGSGAADTRSESLSFEDAGMQAPSEASNKMATTTIQGKVLDEYTGQPLMGANVYTGSGAGTVTDAEGNFKLEVESGEQEVIAGYLGYEEQKRKVSTRSKAEVQLDMSLAPATESLSEVTVSKSNDKPSAYDEYFAGNYKSAAGKFDDLVKDNPDDLEAKYYLGLSNYNANKMNKAISAFDDILSQPDNLFTDGALWYKAQALIEKGKESDALPLLKQLSSKQNSYQQSASEQLLDLEE